MTNPLGKFVVVVPAAGIGKRMQAQCPKQYLIIDGVTILEHTVNRLLSHPKIFKVVIVLGKNDEYFAGTSLVNNAFVSTVIGGKERVDSVLAGLKSIDKNLFPWVLVHDAARPCVSHLDITSLIEHSLQHDIGGLLAIPVRDTMKQASLTSTTFNKGPLVQQTVPRNHLWHALTPQMFRSEELQLAIIQALSREVDITDESSAMELAGFTSALIEGRGDNIKITQQDDLALAAFILSKQKVETEGFNKKESSCE